MKKIVKFYAINDNFESIEFLTLEKAINSKKWLVIAIMTKYEDQSNTLNKPIINFKFINFQESDERLQIIKNNWTGYIDLIDNTQFFPSFDVKFGFASPSGIIQHKYCKNGINAITDGIKYFFEISNFNDWEEYKQKQECIKLKQENEELRNKILELESQLKSK